MAGQFPLPTLLSHALVAFTIEFDNESERQMIHRTTRHGSKSGSLQVPWLVSLAMWSNCMQFVGDEGTPVGELERRARTKTNLAGLQRWGYIILEPDPAQLRSKLSRAAGLVRVTPAGRSAQEVWRPLVGSIEKRWEERFGKNQIDQLRKPLLAMAGQLDVELPDCLPILGYGLFSKGEEYERRAARPGHRTVTPLPLPTLFSRLLLTFGIEFESESDLSLAISANVVRVLDEKGTPVRDLPLLAGVSKEAIAVSLSFLTKRGHAVVEAVQKARRTKFARLTPKGRKARDRYHQLLDLIEKRWQTRFGQETIRSLRKSLEQLVGDPSEELSPLFRGLDPYPGGWRASLPKPNTLPHYPMVLHRGGFPDGS